MLDADDEKVIKAAGIKDNNVIKSLDLTFFQVLLLSFSLILFPRFQPLSHSRTADPADFSTAKGVCVLVY